MGNIIQDAKLNAMDGVVSNCKISLFCFDTTEKTSIAESHTSTNYMTMLLPHTIAMLESSVVESVCLSNSWCTSR